MPNPKTVNYTDEMESRMTEVYTAATDEVQRNEAVERLASEFGKKVRSVRSKLSSMKIYVAAEKVSGVTGEKPELKADMAARLSELANYDFVSAEKMNKTDIAFLIEHFTPAEA